MQADGGHERGGQADREGKGACFVLFPAVFLAISIDQVQQILPRQNRANLSLPASNRAVSQWDLGCFGGLLKNEAVGDVIERVQHKVAAREKIGRVFCCHSHLNGVNFHQWIHGQHAVFGSQNLGLAQVRG